MSPAIRSIRRRNALIPLPLLPPVPRNTIVTSVRIVHNQSTPDPAIFDSTASHLPQVRGFSNSPSPPPSPTPTNLCFAPLTGGGTKRLRSGRRRSSCTPCQPPPGSQRASQKQPPCSVAVPFDGGADSRTDPSAHVSPPDNSFDSSLLNPNRKPRSTIVVTVRLANPPPSNASYGSRSSDLVSGPRRTRYGDASPEDAEGIVLSTRPDQVIGVGDAFAAMQARVMVHRPRVSSPLALSVVTSGEDLDQAPMDPWDVSPLSSPPPSWARFSDGGASHSRGPFVPNARRYTKKSKSGSKKGSKGKGGGRVGLLRWAVLNNSGPEVGRRILAMGPKLAQEIWEAERYSDEMERAETNEVDIMEQNHGGNVDPQEDSDQLVTEPAKGCDTEEQMTRQLLAEECIRELEEMEVDSEDTEMEQSSIMEVSPETLPTPEVTMTEKATETHQIEKNNNRMDLDMPAPVAVVTPLSTARQVQIQLEIAVQVFSPAKKAQKDVEKSRRWFERIAL